jgi:hypothetical protein
MPQVLPLQVATGQSKSAFLVCSSGLLSQVSYSHLSSVMKPVLSVAFALPAVSHAPSLNPQQLLTEHDGNGHTPGLMVLGVLISRTRSPF